MLSAFLGVALIIGCSGEDGGDSGPETYADFCRQAATAETARRVACVELASEAASFVAARLEQACLADGAAVAAGRMRYDKGAANTCLGKVAQRSCGSGGSTARLNCPSAVTGAVAAGGNCLESGECADGTRCLQTGGEVCAFGTCEALVAVDAACAAGQKCVAGAYCYQGTGTCQPLVAISGDCSSGRECVAEASCRNNVCEGPVPVDGACTQGQECVAGAECHQGTCQVPVPAGGACDETTFCATAWCINGKCLAIAGPNQPCGLMLGTGCQDGYYCSGVQGANGTCLAGKTSGACQSEMECAWGFSCEGGSCTPDGALLRISETCVVGDRECVEGAWCSGGTCALAPKLTEACDSLSGEPRPCLEGYCSSGASPVCTAFAKLDESCSGTAKCAPDLVCDAATSKCVKCP